MCSRLFVEVPPQTLRLFEQLEVHDIFLIEWQHPLLICLGYQTLVRQNDYFFLAPDEQLPIIEHLAAGLGYQPADHKTLPPAYSSEYSNLGLRYIIREFEKSRFNVNPWNRLVFLPLSWTSISRDEATRLSASENKLPCTVHTVSISVACTALMRIMTREKRGSRLRARVTAELVNAITHHYFDTSYEGDYMDIPPDTQPWTEKEVTEMNNAIKDIESWKMREGEEWIRSELIRAVSGKIGYHELSCGKE
ncbi:uncharacterized protein F4822DRAFT_442760 [Hypoxylon trugodes]|uniref:uncharacterized protein n=1 Tax=Hypoxylon trugodes TaxID=326681 RepID=UPI002197ACA3|nr:uncharacterized protein F4822DRAFT_442760 [Hypoxylon trugodes]KAI1389473.1 hypothetical protein F4822DRAFT_442760 [Hypoxylon trugodes]